MFPQLLRMENAKSCVLCLKKDLNDCGVKLDIEKVQLLKIPVNLDANLKDAAICNECEIIYQQSYNFKKTCLSNDNYLNNFRQSSVDKRLILEEIIVREIKNEVQYEEEKVCRFCLIYCEANSVMEVNLEQDVVMRIGKCLPELELHSVQDPHICYNCLELLTNYFNLMSHCEYGGLKSFKQETANSRNNQNMLNINNEAIAYDQNFVEKEEHCEELSDFKFKIETEDLDLKKVVNDVEKNFDTSGNTEDKTFACNICPFQTHRKDILKNHLQVHEELTDKAFKCDHCLYVTKKKTNLVKHYLLHKNPSEIPMFKCKECPYESKWKSNLINHELIHKNRLEVTFYKCTECPFQTKHKSCLPRHKKNHVTSGGEDKKIFICNECNIKVKLKSTLVKHLMIHKEKKQISNDRKNNSK